MSRRRKDWKPRVGGVADADGGERCQLKRSLAAPLQLVTFVCGADDLPCTRK